MDLGGTSISAIVPNYNHGALIGDAVKALAGQVPPPDEIIVVDDCSTDASVAIIRGLAEQYPRLRLIQLESNRGAIAALNEGLAAARGTYIYFGAADDFVRPDLFASSLEMLKRFPQAAFACCEAIVLDRETGVRSPRPPIRPAHRAAYFPPAKVASLLRRCDNWIITGSALARRELIAEAGGFDGALGSFADGYLFRRLALRHGCCFIPRAGVVWQISHTGYSRSFVTDAAASARLLREATRRLRSDTAFPPWYAQMFARRWRFAVGRLAVLSDPFNESVLRNVSARGRPGKLIVGLGIAIGGRTGRIGILGWLFLREHPMSAWGLIRTMIARRLFSP